MFSAGKLLLTALVILVAILAFRMMARRTLGSRRRAPVRSTATAAGAPLDLMACRTCGAFVGRQAGACARADCPQRA